MSCKKEKKNESRQEIKNLSLKFVQYVVLFSMGTKMSRSSFFFLFETTQIEINWSLYDKNS